MSSDESTDKECPLCMEAFDFDDLKFFPCTCQYQICRFCWHRLRTDENGLCPACRQPYSDQPVNFQPVSTTDYQRIKSEKKQSKQKAKPADCRKHLANYRVLQKNLVYVVGLSQRMADVEVLKKPEYFGKYGKVVKVAVGSSTTTNGTGNAISCTAYVTYDKVDQALKAIEAVNNLIVEGRMLKASLGTTKYCSTFLRGQQCHKPECMYLHDIADDEISFTKEDMHNGKHTEFERKLHEQLALRTREELQKRRISESDSQMPAHEPGETNQLEKSVSPSIFSGASVNIEPASTSFLIDTSAVQKHSPTPEALPVTDSKISRSPKKKNKQNSETSTKSEMSKSAPEPRNRKLDSAEDYPARKKIQRQSGNNDNSSGDDRESQSALQPSACASPEVAEELVVVSEDAESEVRKHQEIPRPPGFESITVAQIGSSPDSNKENIVEASQSSSSTSAVPNRYATCDEIERLILADNTPSRPTTAQGDMPGSFPASSYSNFDDDLGFDPFSESSKALADLVLEEKTMPKAETVRPPNRRLPAFPQASGSASSQRLEELFASVRSHGHQTSGTLYSSNLEGAEQSGVPNPAPTAQPRLFERLQNRPPGFDESPWTGSSQNTPASDSTPPVLQSIFSAYQTGNTSQQQTQQQTAMYNHVMHEYLYRQHLLFREQAVAALNAVGGQRGAVASHTTTPPGTAVPHSGQSNQSQTSMPVALAQLYNSHQTQNPNLQLAQQLQKIQQQYRHSQNGNAQEWREGFKAMLPNVNIRFVNESKSAPHFLRSATDSESAGSRVGHGVDNEQSLLHQALPRGTTNAIYNGYADSEMFPQKQQILQHQSHQSQLMQSLLGGMLPSSQQAYQQHLLFQQQMSSTTGHQSSTAHNNWVPPPPGFSTSAVSTTSQADR